MNFDQDLSLRNFYISRACKQTLATASFDILILCFWKETIQEKWWCGSFSICFPHRSTTAVQTTLVTPVAIRTWTISSIICPVLQARTDDAASGISFGVSLCLMPTFWPVQQGRPCQ